MIRTLSDEEARTVFHQASVGRLGCIRAGEPYVVPVNYYPEGEFAYIHSLPGQKIEALRSHPRACLQLENIVDRTHWVCVLAYGTYEEIIDPSEKLRRLEHFAEYFPFFTPVEAVVPVPGEPTETIVFRLRIDRIEGVEEN